MELRILYFVLLCGFATAQEFNVDSDLGLDHLSDNVTFFLEKINLAETGELTKLCKDPAQAAKVKAAGEEALNCTLKNFDIKTIQDEIAKAKKGDLDIVFKKYCQKAPEVKNCLGKLTEATEACMGPEQLANRAKAINVTNSLLDFACYRDGDRIAVFIASGGVKCLADSKDEIQKCVKNSFKGGAAGPAPGPAPGPEPGKNKTMAGANGTSPAPPVGAIDADFPSLLMKSADCKTLTDAQQCVVTAMEKKCKDSTPGNVADALFNFVRRQTDTCKPTDGASALAVFTFLPFALIAVLRSL